MFRGIYICYVFFLFDKDAIFMLSYFFIIIIGSDGILR